MRRNYMLLLLVATLVLAGCYTSQITDGDNQTCPSWAGYAQNSQCAVRIWKARTCNCNTDTVHFDDREKVRITFNHEVVIDDQINVKVSTDAGAEVVVKLLEAGSYVFIKQDLATAASFKLSEVDDNTVQFTAEFVKRIQQ